jgi:hypothetical protein
MSRRHWKKRAYGPGFSGVGGFADVGGAGDAKDDGRIGVEGDNVTKIGDDVTTLICLKAPRHSA